ncbi:MAG: DUF3837 family protein [Lachnospiraceae bacterium]
MVHELTLKSVQLKTTIFQPPAKLINGKELCCAFGIAFKQAGKPLPEMKEGQDIQAFYQECRALLGDGQAVDEKLLQVIEHYVFKAGETTDEDCRITMQMGYEIG